MPEEKFSLDATSRDRIVLTFLRRRDRYLRLADFLRALIEGDPTIPPGTVYAIKYRLKNESRLVEKIEQHNGQCEPEASISADNFTEQVDDLLGVRVVCLLPSAVGQVDALMRSLKDEERLEFVREPQLKKTFDIPLNPKERDSGDVQLQYSGYASNHYIVRPGLKSGAAGDLRELRAEIQVRTIFEEAWGEIDHARYEAAAAAERFRGRYSAASTS